MDGQPKLLDTMFKAFAVSRARKDLLRGLHTSSQVPVGV